MAQARNDVSRLGGEYMIQDRDHMSDADQAADQRAQGGVRQSEQSQSGNRQQGGDDYGDSRQQGGQRRQAH